MDHSKKQSYLFSIDALRVIAILAVILIHSTTKTLQVIDHDIVAAPLTLFLNQFARFAVPLFFLISGFVLELNNKKGLSYLNFFKKRASRVVMPFIFWSCLYALVGNSFNPAKLISENFLIQLVTGTASYHLYFIPTLILFYLMFPLLHQVIDILRKPVVLAAFFTIQLVLLYQNYYVAKLPLENNILIAVLSFSMFTSGMVASHFNEKIYDFVKKYFPLFLTSLLTIVTVIYIHVTDLTLKQKTTSYIYNQFSPLNYLFTLIFASNMYYIFEKTGIFRKVFIGLSKLSFFVFFVHVLIQALVWDNVFKHMTILDSKNFITLLIFDPFAFLLIAGISFGIAYLVHRIPYAYKITG